MNIKKNNNKNVIIILIITIIVSFLLIGIWAYYKNKKPVIQTTETTINSTLERATQDKDKTTIQNESTGSITPDTSLTITYINQNDNTLQIRTLINRLWSNGQCTISLTKNLTEVTESVNTEALPSSSTCQGFDIPTSKLSVGTWHVKITAKQNSDIITTEQDIDIK